jgi:glycosyltransferase involved in cell wall biosynthesis
LQILILYTELAGYVLSSFKHFIEQHPEAELIVVHYPVNPEAPFIIKDIPKTTFIQYDPTNWHTLKEKLNHFNPNIILCSGWINKDYISFVKTIKTNIKKVVLIDNHWNANAKQLVFSILSKLKLTFLKHFTHAWVPGKPQKLYARKLGFETKNIIEGFYVADTDLFIKTGALKLKNKGAFPKIILSVARYIPQKDLPTLCKAFINVNQKNGNQWQLHCIGQGALFNDRIENPYIFHLGFKQPNEMEPYVLAAGIYALPSLFEPWAVSVHEMALSAMPMVLSNKVGAASQFLTENNGFEFEAGNQKSLENQLDKIMKMPDEALWKMAESSFELGQSLTTQNWSDNLLKIYQS